MWTFNDEWVSSNASGFLPSPVKLLFWRNIFYLCKYNYGCDITTMMNLKLFVVSTYELGYIWKLVLTVNIEYQSFIFHTVAPLTALLAGRWLLHGTVYEDSRCAEPVKEVQRASATKASYRVAFVDMFSRSCRCCSVMGTQTQSGGKQKVNSYSHLESSLPVLKPNQREHVSCAPVFPSLWSCAEGTCIHPHPLNQTFFRKGLFLLCWAATYWTLVPLSGLHWH